MRERLVAEFTCGERQSECAGIRAAMRMTLRVRELGSVGTLPEL